MRRRHVLWVTLSVSLALFAVPSFAPGAAGSGGKVTFDLRLRLLETGRFTASGAISDSGKATWRSQPVVGKFLYASLTLGGKNGTIRIRVRATQKTEQRPEPFLDWTIVSGSSSYSSLKGRGAFSRYVVNGPFTHIVMTGRVSR